MALYFKLVNFVCMTAVNIMYIPRTLLDFVVVLCVQCTTHYSTVQRITLCRRNWMQWHGFMNVCL